MVRITPRITPRWARFPQIFFATVILAAPALAQLAEPQSTESGDPQAKPAGAEKNSPARHEAALAMLDLVLAGARNLSLPQNRIAIESEAFPLLWHHNESQARALVNQMIGDFAQAAGRQEESPDRNTRPILRQQWQIVFQNIAQADAELALSFLNASRSFVQTGNPEEEEAEERGLRLDLAAQEAARNPRKALSVAEKDLQAPGDLPEELINLLSQVAAKDAEAGAQLLHDIVSRVRGADLSSGEGNFTFAVSLLDAQAAGLTNDAAPDEALKTLADAVVSAALNPQFPSTNFPNLQGSMTTLEKFSPARAQLLQQKLAEYIRSLTPELRSWDQFGEAQASGDPNQLLAVAEQAPADVRANMYQQAAWQFANIGDLQRARQVAANLTDPFQRDQVLQQATRQTAANASNAGDFATARQRAEQITPEEDRATMLAQIALNAAVANQQTLALEILEEAGGLLTNRTPGSSAYAAQLQVAQAFARLKPARAVPLLERSASQLEQVLSAAVQVDAFLYRQRSFDEGELILNNGSLFSSLVQPYAQATAELANSDFAAARILADRLPLPEARLMAELFVARAVLGDPAPVAQASIRGDFVLIQE
jgi:hypothetical protein